MNGRLIRSVAGLSIILSTVAACSSDDDDDTTTVVTVADTAAPTPTDAADTTAAAAETTAGDASAGGTEFVIADFGFPAGFTVKAGEEITLKNDDSFAHTVTSDDFDVRVDGGSTEPLTIDKPGEYAIHCEIHPQMSGTITVE